MEHKKHKAQKHTLNDIYISLQCKMCNHISKSKAGLSSHLRWKHDETYESYVLRCYNIDLIKLDEDYKLNIINNEKEKKEKEIKRLKKYTDTLKGKPIKERLGEEGYKKFLESMKGIYTLDWFIKKYGEDLGKLKYKERCENVSKISHFRIYNKQNKQNWSKISQELFNELYKNIGSKFKKIYYGELNHEYSCGIQNHNFDFVILDNKKVIEFNGNKYHANPELYNENDIPLKYIGKTAKEIWEEDRKKIEQLKKKGFSVLIIWEKDFLKNKDNVILECLKFILA